MELCTILRLARECFQRNDLRLTTYGGQLCLRGVLLDFMAHVRAVSAVIDGFSCGKAYKRVRLLGSIHSFPRLFSLWWVYSPGYIPLLDRDTNTIDRIRFQLM